MGMYINPLLVLGMFIVPAVWAYLVGYIANEKGRSGLNWGISGFFFGILALVAICAVPVANSIEQQEKQKCDGSGEES